MEENSSSNLISDKSISISNTIPEPFISYSNKKKSKLKKTLINSLFYYDKHPAIFTLFKIIIGFLILGVPAIAIMSLVYFFKPLPSKYLFLPNIITITISVAALTMILVIKGRYNIIQSGLLISSWERLGICKIIGCLILNCFILSILMRLESISINVPFYQANVTQVESSEYPAKQLTQGSFIFRLIFLSFFWSIKHEHLGYFYIDNRFLCEFKESLSHVFKSILAFAIYYLIKMTFFESKNTFVYLIITIVTIYECFLFIYFPLDGTDHHHNANCFFFNHSKYFEVIPLFFILFSYSWLGIKNNIIKLIKKKLYPYRTKKKNYFTVIVAFLFFGCIAVGLTILLYVLMHLLFVKIECMYINIFYI